MGYNMACGRDHHLEDPHNVSNYFPFLYVNHSESYMVHGFIVLICIIGLLGNGVVLWFLCSNKRRHSFTFIINLSVADFGVVLALSLNVLLFFGVNGQGRSNNATYIAHLCLHNTYACMHYASANFLMIISVDRCVAVLFPIWHRRRRHSKSVLAVMSVFLWVLSCLMAGLSFLSRFCYQEFTSNIVAFSVIYFLMVFSTGVLSFKVCCSSRLRQRGKLLLAILISLVFFIITMAPRGIFSELEQESKVMSSLLLLKALNSSVNPIIYFFVGILKASPARKTLKAVFEKFFKEEEYTEEEERETSTNMNTIATTSATASSYICAYPSEGALSKPGVF